MDLDFGSTIGLYDLYGDNKKQAAAKSVEALAMFFAKFVWTPQKIAQKEGKSAPWVTYQLCFGRFLNFFTTVNNSENGSLGLTEWKFRKFWEGTEGGEYARFQAVLSAMEGATMHRPARPKIGNAIVEHFADGQWHALPTIAKTVGEGDEDHVADTLKTMKDHKTYGVSKVESHPYKATKQFRIFRADKTVSTEEIQTKLDPIITGLEAEGKKNMATMSPGTVARLAALLRRQVQDWIK